MTGFYNCRVILARGKPIRPLARVMLTAPPAVTKKNTPVLRFTGPFLLGVHMLVRSFRALLAFGIATCSAVLTAQTLSATTPLQYTALQTPCRAVDTRVTAAPSPLVPANPLILRGCLQHSASECGTHRLRLECHSCAARPIGYLSVWPTGATQPLVSTLNSPDGRVKANAALATGGNGGEISVYATNTTDLVLDVSGYFTSAPAADVYVPVTPCRVVDTRVNNGTSFGAPSLVAGHRAH
jgi:hypothetical protein